jgi:hypothetical protein
VHQQALRIDKDCLLLAFDFLAPIVAGRIEADPLFSALLEPMWVVKPGLPRWRAPGRRR